MCFVKRIAESIGRNKNSGEHKQTIEEVVRRIEEAEQRSRKRYESASNNTAWKFYYRFFSFVAIKR